ncbi:MAG: Serine/threonine-protein kinase PknF [Planctomycetota bacterium]|jgi:serine/threonine protein kinase
MSTVIELTPESEVLPGYRLLRKLGAGGYGEVWLCDAPGGLRKAIKFIYGTVEEDRASAELRSLNRIREVKHPFILSLERIEVLDGRVLIVTELAESSLYDQYQAYLHEGLPGIPQNKLLGYMRDTAEALDFLAIKHDLQHLDIKPANLLLVADRIKVADFGVVKNISEKNISCVGGLTPCYAAPEIFDGRAGRHSDQYSLAIVYYELLTGKLPFNGSTMAKLASQHLYSEPCLDAVSEQQRIVLARALAKEASYRYPTCSEFIEHLQSACHDDAVSETSSDPSLEENATAHRANVVRRRIASQFNKIPGKNSTVLIPKKPIKNLPRLPDSNNGSWQHARRIFIGLGGTGCQILSQLRDYFAESDVPDENTKWLMIDCHSDDMTACSQSSKKEFSQSEKLILPLRDPSYYRDSDSNTFTSISRRWLYNIPRGFTTGGARPLGQVALLDNQKLAGNVLTEIITESLKDYGENVADHSVSHHEAELPPRIYLLTSAHGGAGSAWFCDVGFAIRNILTDLNISNYRLIGITTAAPGGRERKDLIPSAAAKSFFIELAHYFNTKNEYHGLLESPFYGSDFDPKLRKPPVDCVYCIPSTQLESKNDLRVAVQGIAQLITLDSSTSLGQSLDQARAETETKVENSRTPWLRTIAFRSCPIEPKDKLAEIVQTCIGEYCRKWFPQSEKRKKAHSPSQAQQPDIARTTEVFFECEEFMEELSEQLSGLISDMNFTPEGWMRSCGNALKATYPQSSDLFKEPTLPIAKHLVKDIFKRCISAGHDSKIPCKIVVGLLTGVHLQVLKLEETLRKSKAKHEHDLEGLSLIDSNRDCVPSKTAQPRKQSTVPSQIDNVCRKLRIIIARYTCAIQILQQTIQLMDEPLQVYRRRLSKLQNAWSFWPSILPNQNVLSHLKNSSPETVGIQLAELIQKTREHVSESFRWLSTQFVLGEEGAGIKIGSANPELIKHFKESANFALDFPPLLATLENTLKEEHADLIDGKLEQVWFQHTAGQSIRQIVRELENPLGDGGGARRLFMATPVGQAATLCDGNWREQMDIPIAIVSAPVDEKIVAIELEQLDLSDICQRFWGSSEQLNSLVERMYSRTDMAWEPLETASPSPEADEN